MSRDIFFCDYHVSSLSQGVLSDIVCYPLHLKFIFLRVPRHTVLGYLVSSLSRVTDNFSSISEQDVPGIIWYPSCLRNDFLKLSAYYFTRKSICIQQSIFVPPNTCEGQVLSPPSPSVTTKYSWTYLVPSSLVFTRWVACFVEHIITIVISDIGSFQ